MAARKYAGIIVATAVAYFSLFQLNSYFFSSSGFSEGVNWIFLPSGLRLVFILLFVESGAVGIMAASVFISYFYQFEGNLLTIAGAGFLSGFAPWLARLICIDRFNLDVDLKNLTPATLFKIAVLFSVLSSVLHQLWYILRGVTENFVNSATVMALGDLLGTVVVLYAAKGVLALLPVARNN